MESKRQAATRSAEVRRRATGAHPAAFPAPARCAIRRCGGREESRSFNGSNFKPARQRNKETSLKRYCHALDARHVPLTVDPACPSLPILSPLQKTAAKRSNALNHTGAPNSSSASSASSASSSLSRRPSVTPTVRPSSTGRSERVRRKAAAVGLSPMAALDSPAKGCAAAAAAAVTEPSTAAAAAAPADPAQRTACQGDALLAAARAAGAAAAEAPAAAQQAQAQPSKRAHRQNAAGAAAPAAPAQAAAAPAVLQAGAPGPAAAGAL